MNHSIHLKAVEYFLKEKFAAYKLPRKILMFTEDDLAQQQRVKCAFDPNHQLNPGKVYPTLHRCAELGRMHISRGQVPFPDIPRF